MDPLLREIVFITGRILFGGFFLMSGANHFMKLSAMTQYAQSKGVPSPKLAVMATGLLLMLGGVGFILWRYLLIASLLLIVFLVFVSFIMHRFWKEEDPGAKMVEMTNFMKNMAGKHLF